jgi:hypothetical protein
MSIIADLDARIDTGIAMADPPPSNGEWREPEPLTDPADRPEPYPVAQLPRTLREAVVEYRAYGQQPVSLVAGAALASTSLAVQGLVNVRRDGQLCGPTSLSLLTVAESGERKTAADRCLRAGADAWQKETTKRLAPRIAERTALLEAFEAERAGLASAMRQAAAKKKSDARDADVEACRRAITEHATKRPIAAPVPALFHENATIEGLSKSLRLEWPSSSWWSNEAGAIVGGHGFSDDAAMRTLSTLNSLWDGQPLDRSRSTETRSIVYGRRLTVSLMLQPVVFGRLVAGQDGLARGLGSLARFLASWPETTMGTRLYASPGEMQAVARLHDRIGALLDHRLPMPFDLEAFRADDEDGDALELEPTELRLDRGAFEVWREYHDDVERELAGDGDSAAVRDVASKSADNASRLAAIFHVLDRGPHGQINAGAMEAGCHLAAWYLYEARRMLAGAVVAGDAADAAGDAKILANWLLERATAPALKDLSQLAPYRVRKKSRRDRAIEFLQAKSWVRLAPRDGRTVVLLNPALRGGS